EESIKEIVSFNNLLQDNFNFKVKYFRPPYGRFNLSTSFTLKKMNLQNVMWSLLTYDFKNDFSVVKSSVNYYLKNNSIIILHDSIKSSSIISDSIQYIIDSAVLKNIQFGKPEE